MHGNASEIHGRVHCLLGSAWAALAIFPIFGVPIVHTYSCIYVHHLHTICWPKLAGLGWQVVLLGSLCHVPDYAKIVQTDPVAVEL